MRFSNAARIARTLGVAAFLAIALCSRAATVHAQADQTATAPAPASVARTDQSGPGVAAVQARLEAARLERAEASTFFPWLAVGIGAGSAVLSGIAGTVHVATCDAPCGTLSWVAFAAVAGVTLGTLGVIWVVHAEAHVRELDSHRYQLERELERLELSRLQHEPGMTTLSRPRTGPLLSLRFSL